METDAYTGGAFETLPADGYAFVCRGGGASKVPVGGMGVLNAAGKWCGAAAGCPQWVRGGGKGGACEGQGGGVCEEGLFCECKCGGCIEEGGKNRWGA